MYIYAYDVSLEPQVQARLEAEGWDTDANPVTAQGREPAVPAGDAGRGRGGRGGAGAGTAPGVASMVFLCVMFYGFPVCCVGGPPVRLQHSHLAVVKSGVKSVRQNSIRYVAAKLRPTAASAGRSCASSAVTGS